MNLKNFLPRRQVLAPLFTTLVLTGSLAALSQTNIAVASNKMNVLYIGVDNPVSVAASGSAADKVTVSVSGGDGTVSKVSPGLIMYGWQALPTNACSTCMWMEK